MTRVLLAAACLCASFPSLAQDNIPVEPLREPVTEATLAASEDEAVQLETVVVTGEKLGRTLQQTASSVGIVTGQSIDEYGETSVLKSFKRLANVMTADDGNFSIRGVSGGGAEGYTDGQPVISTYIDGIAVDSTATGGGIFDAFDVQQEEVLRGAQSTSQGRNALAGAVVISTREPTDFWDLRTRLRAAERDGREVAMAGGGPLGAGFSFRLTGDLQDDKGFITNTTRDDADWAATQNRLLRAKLAWKPASLPELGVLLTSGYSRLSENSMYTFEPDDGTSQERTVTNEQPGGETTSSRPSSLRVSWQFSPEVALTSTTGFIESRMQGQEDYDRTEFEGGVFFRNLGGRNITQELRLGIEDLNGFSGVVGLYAGSFRTRFSNRYYGAQIAVGDVLPIPVVGDLVQGDVDGYNTTRTRADNAAIFAEFDYAATEHFTITAGLRYDREDSSVTSDYDVTRADGYLSAPAQLAFLNAALKRGPKLDLRVPLRLAGVLPSTGGAQTSEASYDALLPKLGLRFAVTPDTTAFLTYSEAYRAGGSHIIVTTGENKTFQPEYTRNWETGLRTQWWERRLSTRFNLYHTQWTDQQVGITSDDGLSYYIDNAATSRLYGAELENQLRASEHFSAYANFGWSHARFSNYVSSDGDFSGNHFVDAPEYTGSTGMIIRGGNGPFAAVNYSYTGSHYSTPDNDERETGDARRLLDARIGWEGRVFSAYVFGRNLLDQDYVLERYLTTASLGIPKAGRLNYYAEPRTLGAQIEIRL